MKWLIAKGARAEIARAVVGILAGLGLLNAAQAMVAGEAVSCLAAALSG